MHSKSHVQFCGILGSMNVVFFINRSFCLGLAMMVGACHHAPPYLPSRPLADMFPRGSSPPQDCPGQYRATLETGDGSFFMGCWGIKANER
jgi:hypothetical protein